MKYVALIYGDESRWDAMSDEERAAVYERYGAFERALAGKGAQGAELASSQTATTVRVRNGATSVTDGPFAETKEQLGGLYVLDCDSLDEAVALAAQIPGAATGAVEVRAAYEEPAS